MKLGNAKIRQVNMTHSAVLYNQSDATGLRGNGIDHRSARVNGRDLMELGWC